MNEPQMHLKCCCMTYLCISHLVFLTFWMFCRSTKSFLDIYKKYTKTIDFMFLQVIKNSCWWGGGAVVLWSFGIQCVDNAHHFSTATFPLSGISVSSMSDNLKSLDPFLSIIFPLASLLPLLTWVLPWRNCQLRSQVDSSSFLLSHAF